MNEVLSGAIASGDQTLEIDYSEYARAEAALAWLNLRAVFEPKGLLSPAMLLGPLLDHLDAALSAEKISIAHLKAIVTSPTGFLKAAICGNGQEPIVEGDLDASPAGRLELLLNLRAVGEPAEVREIVEREIQSWTRPDPVTSTALVPQRRYRSGAFREPAEAGAEECVFEGYGLHSRRKCRTWARLCAVPSDVRFLGLRQKRGIRCS